MLWVLVARAIVGVGVVPVELRALAVLQLAVPVLVARASLPRDAELAPREPRLRNHVVLVILLVLASLTRWSSPRQLLNPLLVRHVEKVVHHGSRRGLEPGQQNGSVGILADLVHHDWWYLEPSIRLEALRLVVHRFLRDLLA